MKRTIRAAAMLIGTLAVALAVSAAALPDHRTAVPLADPVPVGGHTVTVPTGPGDDDDTDDLTWQI
ncbi:hypothetical protein RB614_43995 [Phytohabitans sp. ZYX-F-186]|uniref:Uncharacterized protein n=2 Tax=Phytohabitans maris TaxID=3071409 RepID=A0ABU0ZX03_9ACTN|nr:hypothetical protein [Phytohabitans sp. ZYX-F-186]